MMNGDGEVLIAVLEVITRREPLLSEQKQWANNFTLVAPHGSNSQQYLSHRCIVCSMHPQQLCYVHGRKSFLFAELGI